MPVANDEEFRAWLEKQSPQTCMGIAYRAAMRVLPLTFFRPDNATENSGERLALVSLRAAITCGVAAQRMSSDVVGDFAAHVAIAASNSAFQVNYPTNSLHASKYPTNVAEYAAEYPDAAAVNAAAHAAFAADFPADSPAMSAVAANACAAIASDYFVTGSSIIINESAYKDANEITDHLASSSIQVPNDLLRLFSETEMYRKGFGAGSDRWTFWAKWYDRAMAGDPLPWDLQEQVVLIPDDVWEAGVEAVAEAIARIEARFAVLSKIEEIEGAADAGSDKRLGIGGNNPPESLEPNPEDVERALLIWDAVRSLDNEARSSEANPEKVEEAVEALNVGYWHLEAKNYSPAEVIGLSIASNAGFGLAVWLLNPTNIQLLISLARDWLKLLS